MSEWILGVPTVQGFSSPCPQWAGHRAVINGIWQRQETTNQSGEVDFLGKQTKRMNGPVDRVRALGNEPYLRRKRDPTGSRLKIAALRHKEVT